MSKKIKLTVKQLEILTSIQKQKEEVAKSLSTLNQYEGLVLSLVMEQSKITEQPSSVKIEGEFLVFDFEDSSTKQKN